jgi:hypothetical protein
MSQFAAPDQTVVVDRKTSGFAVTSFICSLIFCCPLTTILGVILGLIALVSIGKNPARKGKGLALAGIIIGIVATIAQLAGGSWAWQNIYSHIFMGPSKVFLAGEAGDMTDFRAMTTEGAYSATDEQITAFFAELTKRYGAFEDLRWNPENQGSEQPIGQTRASFAYLINFANKKNVKVEAELVFVNEHTGELEIKWAEFTIRDDELGDLSLPPKTDEGS